MGFRAWVLFSLSSLVFRDAPILEILSPDQSSTFKIQVPNPKPQTLEARGALPALRDSESRNPKP